MKLNHSGKRNLSQWRARLDEQYRRLQTERVEARHGIVAARVAGRENEAKLYEARLATLTSKLDETHTRIKRAWGEK